MIVRKARYFFHIQFPSWIAILLVLTACQKKEQSPELNFKKVSNSKVLVSNQSHLELTPIEEKLFPKTVDFTGKVSIPDRDLQVMSARVAGRIEEILVTPGDKIKAGTILAKIWSPDLITASEELAIAKGAGDAQMVDLSIQKFKSMGISPEDVESKGSFPIRSPIEGVVLERKLMPGNAIQAGDAILLIAKSGNYQFQAEILPEYAKKIRAGMRFYIEDYTDAKGTITAISPIADPITKLTKVRGTLQEIANKLPSETILKAKVVLQEERVLVFPDKAVIRDDQSEYVFIHSDTDPKEFEKIKIVSEGSLNHKTAVKKTRKLQAGEQVVVSGALLLDRILAED